MYVCDVCVVPSKEVPVARLSLIRFDPSLSIISVIDLVECVNAIESQRSDVVNDQVMFMHVKLKGSDFVLNKAFLKNINY